MEIKTTHIGEITIITPLLEILDANNAMGFKKNMADTLKSSKIIVMDLHHLQFIDSSGCGVLLSCSRQLKKQKGHLKLSAVQDQVQKIFALIRLDRMIDIHPNVDNAIAALEMNSN